MVAGEYAKVKTIGINLQEEIGGGLPAPFQFTTELQKHRGGCNGERS